jgi:DNA-binding beta-propeller fold protein YncE
LPDIGEKADIAQLNGPAGLAIDKDNNIFIAEMHNHVIRKIDARTRIITTVAGCGLKGFAGDDGLAVHAKFNGPLGVSVDTNGNIFIADFFNQRIRKVNARTGIINTIAGTGEAGYNGDEIQACEARLNYPAGVVEDSKGNVYFNDFKNERIRKICTDGMISTYAGTGICGYSGDLGVADEAQINGVYGLAIDKQDNIWAFIHRRYRFLSNPHGRYGTGFGVFDCRKRRERL